MLESSKSPGKLGVKAVNSHGEYSQQCFNFPNSFTFSDRVVFKGYTTNYQLRQSFGDEVLDLKWRRCRGKRSSW